MYFNFTIQRKKRSATITDYSSNGVRIAYKGDFLSVNTIIDIMVDELKIQQQAKTVWTKQIGRLKAVSGLMFL